MAQEHFPSKCSFCGAGMTFHVEKGAKVIDKECGCQASKDYLKAAKPKKEAKA